MKEKFEIFVGKLKVAIVLVLIKIIDTFDCIDFIEAVEDRYHSFIDRFKKKQ